jgi:predicted nucleotidyltransferase
MIARVERALLAGVDALDELGSSYAVVGGLAVGVWSVPRATRDVDLYAELPTERERLQESLERRGFNVPAMSEELARFGVFRSLLKAERVFLDIFDAAGPLGAAILERRKQLTIHGRDLWFVSAEDLAVLKAFSDRPRDWDDLIALLAAPRADLDLRYIEHWAARLDESIGGNDVTLRVAQALERAEKARNKLEP